ncbi:MAG: acetylornithine deacetylase [Solirubrobacteraceae bacterium]
MARAAVGAPRSLGLLAELVALPTVAGKPNRELVDLIAGRLGRAGAAVAVLPGSSRADGFNLHVRVGPAVDGGVVLAAHTDVVAVDGQKWHSDPFALHAEGERLHGRGTSDMKGFVAAAVAAAERACSLPLRRPLTLALSCDEELGCAGVGTLLDMLAGEAVRPGLCVVGEPTGQRVADRHKGKVRLRVDVRGRAVHSATAPAGVNAVTYAARMIVALDELARDLATGARDPAFGVPHATLSIGPITGGTSTNIVPDRCGFEFELRTLPGHDGEAVLFEARAAAAGLSEEMRATAPEAGIELSALSAYPGLAPAASTVEVATAFGLDGSATGTIAVDFGTEAGLYREALGVPVVVCGPGDMARAHRADEYVEAGELAAAERLLDRIVDGLCAA